jgi:hypothetical protein
MNSDQLQFMDHSEIEKIANAYERTKEQVSKKKQLKGSAKAAKKQPAEVPAASTDKKKCATAKSGRKLVPDHLIKVQDNPAKMIA